MISRASLLTSLLASTFRRPAPPLAVASEVDLQQNIQPFDFAANQTPSAMPRAPVVSISHGGGPRPLLGDPEHDEIVKSLKERVPRSLRLGTPDAPRAIVLVTAHWSEKNPTISSGERHGLLYDYYGFPPETYQLNYDAPGSPEIAKQVGEALKNEGLEPEFDDERGWDHGVFVPMLLINPAHDIPIVQLSVMSSESPSDHFRMGRALSTLRESNVAIIGSGFASFHNLRLMFSGITSDPLFKMRNGAWSEAVSDAVLEPDLQLREKKLEQWRKFPGAYEMHPRGGAEHFMPLVVCAGAGGEGKAEFYTDDFVSLPMYSFMWS